MKRLAAILCGLWAALAFASDAAHAEKRVALVVGNGAYQNAPALATTANDANAIADLLRRNSFDVVEVRTDLGNTDFKRVVREFSASARDADVAVMYFGGHGVDIGGKNYLLPVDAKLTSDQDAEDEAVSLDRVMAMLQGAKRLRVVLLDAARENPMIRAMQRSKGGSPAGLARFEPEADDTFVVYSARPGMIADDIPGERGAFANALVKNLAVPGRDLRTAIGFARDDVINSTGGKQEVLVVGAFGGRALALVPEQRATRQISVLPSGASEPEQQPNAAPVKPAGPQKIAVLPAPGSPVAPAPEAAPAPAPAIAPAQNAVTPPPAAAQPAPPAALTRDLQAELKRVGCDPGAINGVWSPASRQALEQFNQRADTKFDAKVASLDALDAVKGQRGRICPLACGGGQRSDGERCVAIPAQPKPQPKRAVAREPEPRKRVRRVVEEDDGPAPPRRAPVVVREREEVPVRSGPRIGIGVPGIGIGLGGIGLGF